jgi:short-subunit dehydrogenase involved in D-alanine esterification of teichoic acids
MKLIVERWIKKIDETTNEEIEIIAEEKEVKDEDEAREVAEEYRTKHDTVRVTLHYCYNYEDPTKPCERVEI